MTEGERSVLGLPIDTDRVGRGEFLIALVLSVPPGIGMVGFLSRLLGVPLSTQAVLGGFVTTLVLFSLVMLLVVTGEPDEDVIEGRNGD
jgi:hypothetical protein